MNSLLALFIRNRRSERKPKTHVGMLPNRRSSLVSLVLAKLLSGYKINAIDLAKESNTSRAKDVIAALRNRYGWSSICSERVLIATTDGRMHWVSQYWLPQEVIALAMTQQTANWMDVIELTRKDLLRNSRSASKRARVSSNAKKNCSTEGGRLPR